MSLCITTVINKQYQRYIPIFVYFCLKSYPMYGVKLVLTEKLDKKYISTVEKLKELGTVEIVEEYGKDLPKNNQELKTLRWLLEPELFDGYDYIYIGDIDIIICREDHTLLDQHLDSCSNTGLSYSNSVRPNSKRMSGLHFIKKPEYYNETLSVIQKYVRLLKEGKLRHISNEKTLYKIVLESGISMPEEWFRPHHGIHLGLWRKGKREISEKTWKVLDKELYKCYYKFYLSLKEDALFKEVLKTSQLKELHYMEKGLSKEFKEK